VRHAGDLAAHTGASVRALDRGLPPTFILTSETCESIDISSTERDGIRGGAAPTVPHCAD
jgi:hypothetical protein